MGDTVHAVDTMWEGKDTAAQSPVCSRELSHVLATSKEVSFTDELVPAAVVSNAESERCSMSLAEREQRSLDTFWGVDAEQANQAQERASMEEEDRRSRAVQTKIEREKMYVLWEEEDLKKREARNVVKEGVEVAARRAYLEKFHNTPSTGFAIDYRWPTHAVLPQEAHERWSPDNAAPSTHDFSTAADALGVTSSLPRMHIRKNRDPNWGTTAVSSSIEKDEPIRPSHTFRGGRKSHSLLFAKNLFVPPRSLVEPSTKLKAVSPRACSHKCPSAACPPAGLAKTVHLPPLPSTPRDGQSTEFSGSDEPYDIRSMYTSRSNRAMLLKPGFPGQPLLPSFERKFSAWCAVRSEEARDKVEEQWSSRGRGWQLWQGNSRGLFHWRRQQGRVWRDREFHNGQRAIELVPEKEEEHLARIFGMVDFRDQGEVRQNDFFFHIKENAKVRSEMKHLTIWTTIKTQLSKWLEDIYSVQDGPTLTLSALLNYGRNLREEKGVPRKHMRLPEALRRKEESHEMGVLARRDTRSKRLLPTDFVEGQEVEALFMKGFQWYRAWIVRCNPDDTFDVSLTPPSPSSLGELFREGKADPAEEHQQPEIDTPPTCCKYESRKENRFFKDDRESNTIELLTNHTANIEQDSFYNEAGEEEWKKTCERVAQYIGTSPDLGLTESKLLEEAFDAIVRLTNEGLGEGSAHNNQDDALLINEVDALTVDNTGREKHSSDDCGSYQVSTGVSELYRHNPLNARDKKDRLRPTEARVPASEVLRLLQKGMLEDYRRASPALSATCIYREFAEGLLEFNSMDGYGRACDDRYPSRKSPGLSKVEFCEYFEAITDFVDLNDLSLVQQKKLP